ncbi:MULTISPECIES: TMEM175 family protein [Chitinophagaceae]
MGKERFEAITDAILAIIATLMLLEIKLGNLSDSGIHRFIGQVLI